MCADDITAAVTAVMAMVMTTVMVTMGTVVAAMMVTVVVALMVTVMVAVTVMMFSLTYRLFSLSQAPGLATYSPIFSSKIHVTCSYTPMLQKGGLRLQEVRACSPQMSCPLEAPPHPSAVSLPRVMSPTAHVPVHNYPCLLASPTRIWDP